ncbi:unnamed protein product, partial [Owenia fusiformis]
LMRKMAASGCKKMLQQVRSLAQCRCISTSASNYKNIRAGVPKTTPDRSKPLTYEEWCHPEHIGERKAWNSWNTSSLCDEPRAAETAIEDMFIRKFIYGTWHNLFASETIIKRRHNIIVLAVPFGGNGYPA